MARLLLDAGLNEARDCSPTLDLNGYGDGIGYGSEYDKNKLKSVPSGVLRMSTLRVLNLSNNLLSELPKGFANLRGLEILNLSLNMFVDFPPDLLVLCANKLRDLNLSNNKLTDDTFLALDPEDVASMMSLQTLDLQLNDDVSTDTIFLLHSMLPALTLLPTWESSGNSPRDRAVAILVGRFESQKQLGEMKESDVQEIEVEAAYSETVDGGDDANKKLYFIGIGAGGAVGGWGDKCMIANLRLNKTFGTQMGFHRAYWARKAYLRLGAPISDEYGNSDPPHDKCGGGATQHFENGNLYWNSQKGVFSGPRIVPAAESGEDKDDSSTTPIAVGSMVKIVPVKVKARH
jgi:hypothetical protein